MEVLTELWDKTTDAFTALSENVSEGLVRIFGSSNERRIRSMRPLVATINDLEPQMQALSDIELKAKTVEFRGRRAAGETLDDLLPEAFAACREAGRRFLNMRHFDVQLMGGMVLHGGDIAEMVTGEGKTLVATLAAYLNALDGKGVHVVTVNDYLARRDAEWMSPLFRRPGNDRRGDPVRDGIDRAPASLRLRHHLRHQQRVRLRLPARQHEAGQGATSARESSTTPSSTRWTAS